MPVNVHPGLEGLALLKGRYFQIPAGKGRRLHYFPGSSKKLAGVTSGVILPSSGPGHALQLFTLLFGDIETDDVHDEFDAGSLEFLHQAAGIRIAGFFAVGDQYDGGFVFQMLDTVCSQAH